MTLCVVFRVWEVCLAGLGEVLLFLTHILNEMKKKKDCVRAELKSVGEKCSASLVFLQSYHVAIYVFLTSYGVVCDSYA